MANAELKAALAEYHRLRALEIEARQQLSKAEADKSYEVLAGPPEQIGSRVRYGLASRDAHEQRGIVLALLAPLSSVEHHRILRDL